MDTTLANMAVVVDVTTQQTAHRDGGPAPPHSPGANLDEDGLLLQHSYH